MIFNILLSESIASWRSFNRHTATVIRRDIVVNPTIACIFYLAGHVESREMASKLAVSRQTVTNRLKMPQEKRVIYRIGSDRKGQWHYRLM